MTIKPIVVAAGLAAFMAGGSAMAQDMSGDQSMDNDMPQVTTAHKHATLAQKAGSVDMTHTHLQHVINCLEGSSGDDFDASAGTPCKGMGDGALKDNLPHARVHQKLESARDEALKGQDTKKLDAAHEAASDVASTLQAVGS